MHILTALVQMNPTVGALRANAATLVEAAHEAQRNGASIVLFPELALSGYPPEDLILKRHFLKEGWEQLEQLAEDFPRDQLIFVGAPRLVDQCAYNAAIIYFGGRIASTYYKMNLPNYGVFDEKRVFTPGNHPLVIQAGPLRLGVHVCEDSWDSKADSIQLLKDARLDAIVNLSASPYHRGKREVREQVLKQTCLHLNAAMLYCNQVGGQDELVFDGNSLALGLDGRVEGRARAFEEDILYAPIECRHPIPTRIDDALPSSRRTEYIPFQPPTPRSEPLPVMRISPPMDDVAEVYAALKTGLKDYVEKNGFKKTVIALSGGIDSALVAALAVDALGPDRVAGITMPSMYSSAETRTDAEILAQRLGIAFHSISIEGIYDTFLRSLNPFWPEQESDLTEENLQARIRGTVIMAFSNRFGWLVLTTGNKSELATGYCTLYGDMVGGFAILKDVPKTLVYELSRWRNQQDPEPVIPPSTIEREPSAELRANQKDSDSLPPYEVLDPIIERYVEKDEGLDQIIAAGFDAEIVKRIGRLIDLSEYKRRQGAPGIKITPKAFGRDRRMPITNAYRKEF